MAGARPGNAPAGIALPHRRGEHVPRDRAFSVVARSRRCPAARQAAEPRALRLRRNRTPDNRCRGRARRCQAIGGGKGARLALAFDHFAGGLPGAARMSEVPTPAAVPRQRRDTGHMLGQIDGAGMMPPAVLGQRVDAAATILRETAPAADNR